MCGIAGIVSRSGIEIQHLKKMTDVIAHRGPDGEGHWISSNGNVGLGHRRLSIIDLRHEADQPMHYMDRYSIVFNGEIYNYLELRSSLKKEGYIFQTQSDTEVLVAMYDRHKEHCLQFLDGMFSFLIYDVQTNAAFAARDRFGEKPFFYHYSEGENFYFGSELKCLWEVDVEKTVDRKMVYNYLKHGLLQDPENPESTFYANCYKLPHSHYMKVDVGKCKISVHKYYDINIEEVDEEITENKAKDVFQHLFYQSVKRRLRSDVAVGSSLSGGLDSSLVVSVIDKIIGDTNQKQNTFSAIFPGFAKDERKYIDLVLKQVNASPHFVVPDEKGLIKELDKLWYHQEEPFGSASIYVQYSVMRLAKENNVIVLLDGQGADEMLAGYHSYYLDYFGELQKKHINLYRKELAVYNNLHKDNIINPRIGVSSLDKVKLFLGNQFPGMKNAYHRLRDSSNALFDKDFLKEVHSNKSPIGTIPSQSLNSALYNSLFKKGLQDLLRYADRNSMAHSREVRLPFLNHELVEFILKLPADFKIRSGWTKWIMRETFSNELPPEIGWRKDKIGYEPPQNNWMAQKDIQSVVRLAKERLADQSILNKDSVNVNEPGHISDWSLLMAGKLFSN